MVKLEVHRKTLSGSVTGPWNV